MAEHPISSGAAVGAGARPRSDRGHHRFDDGPLVSGSATRFRPACRLRRSTPAAAPSST